MQIIFHSHMVSPLAEDESINEFYMYANAV